MQKIDNFFLCFFLLFMNLGWQDVVGGIILDQVPFKANFHLKAKVAIIFLFPYPATS